MYKIWVEWGKKNNIFKGTALDLKDGYIHFSDKDQVKQTLNKFYINQSNLIILKIDALKLKNLVWEQSTDGNMFPHLYSDLDLDFVVKEYTIDLKDDGKHDLPDELWFLTWFSNQVNN